MNRGVIIFYALKRVSAGEKRYDEYNEKRLGAVSRIKIDQIT